MTIQHDRRDRYLVLPGYTVAILLILLPLIDTMVGVWPLRLGEVSWRFGAAGLFSRALLIPLVGLLVVLAVAVIADQRKVLRTVAVFSAFAALILLASLPLFVLDAMQMRAQVRPEAMMSFDLATAVAVTRMVLMLAVVIIFTITGWRAARSRMEPGRSARPLSSADVLVRPQASRE